MKSEQKHENRLMRIINNPQLIRVPHPIWVAKETRLYRGQRLIGEPDILLMGEDNVLYNIEYKCNDTGAQRDKAQKQLQRAYRFIREKGYEGRIKNLMVTGKNLDVEVMR